jgi:photosystem II stability/assembly factor-like uncharacterized protein
MKIQSSRQVSLILLFLVFIFAKCKKTNDPPKESWNKVSLGYSGPLTEIKFLNSNIGFILSSLDLTVFPNQTILFKTIDKGQTWSKISFLKQEAGGFGSFFPSSETVLYAGGDKFYVSNNGGTNWSNINSSQTGYGFLHFFDTQNGIACGLQKVYRTNDAGQNFTVVFNPTMSLATFRKLQFISSNIGYLGAGYTNGSSSYGYLFRSLDGGNSWALQKDNINEVVELFFINATEGWIFTSKNEILRTIDGGVSWQSIAHNVMLYYPKVFFFNSLEGFIAQGSVIFHTTDGGSTWIKEFEDNSYNFTNLFFTADKIGFATDATGKLLRRP